MFRIYTALLLQRKAESEASKRLADKGYAPKLNLAELAANQALAQAQGRSQAVAHGRAILVNVRRSR